MIPVVVLVALVCVPAWLALTAAVVLLLRRRSVRRRPTFPCAVRAPSPRRGISRRWRKGYGFWVHDVFIWWRTASLGQPVVLPVLHSLSPAGPVSPLPRRMGSAPGTVSLLLDDGEVVELAAATAHSRRLPGPFPQVADAEADA